MTRCLLSKMFSGKYNNKVSLDKSVSLAFNVEIYRWKIEQYIDVKIETIPRSKTFTITWQRLTYVHDNCKNKQHVEPQHKVLSNNMALDVHLKEKQDIGVNLDREHVPSKVGTKFHFVKSRLIQCTRKDVDHVTVFSGPIGQSFVMLKMEVKQTQEFQRDKDIMIEN